MNSRTYGILAGVIGSALGAWWYSRYRSAAARGLTPARERGEVIFDNTPTAAPASMEGVL